MPFKLKVFSGCNFNSTKTPKYPVNYLGLSTTSKTVLGTFNETPQFKASTIPRVQSPAVYIRVLRGNLTFRQNLRVVSRLPYWNQLKPLESPCKDHNIAVNEVPDKSDWQAQCHNCEQVGRVGSKVVQGMWRGNPNPSPSHWISLPTYLNPQPLDTWQHTLCIKEVIRLDQFVLVIFGPKTSWPR